MISPQSSARCLILLTLLLLAPLSSCAHEDYPFETINGLDFAYWHVGCVKPGMTEVQVLALLGQPFSKTTSSGGYLWRYWFVEQRKSITRWFGLIPITYYDSPNEWETLVDFHNGGVRSLLPRDESWDCDLSRDNTGMTIGLHP